MYESDFGTRAQIELIMIEQSLGIMDPNSIKHDLGTQKVLDVTGMERDFIYRPILGKILGYPSDGIMEENLIAILKRVSWTYDDTPGTIGWVPCYQALVEGLLNVKKFHRGKFIIKSIL
mgnify:CR=1 FL=1